jgi:hypothetical protein
MVRKILAALIGVLAMVGLHGPRADASWPPQPRGTAVELVSVLPSGCSITRYDSSYYITYCTSSPPGSRFQAVGRDTNNKYHYGPVRWQGSGVTSNVECSIPCNWVNIILWS